MEHQLLVAVPAYNSEKTISALVNGLLKNGNQILIVNDGSSDDTLFHLHKFTGITVISHPENRGLSQSMKTIFGYAITNSCKHVVCMDSDLQHLPGDVDKFKSKNAVLLIGNRFHRNTLDKLPSSKLSSNLLGSLLLLELTGVFYPDVASGFRKYTVESFRNIDLGSDYEAIFKTLFHCIKRSYKIDFVDIDVCYFPGIPHVTRVKELNGFLDSLERSFPVDRKINKLISGVKNREKFDIAIDNIMFYGFYISSIDAYLIQSDIEKTKNKYYEYCNTYSGAQ